MTDTAIVPSPGAQLAAAASARRLADASVSANTRRAYLGALARLDAWLDGRALDDASLAAYLAVLHDAGRAPASASTAVAAARFRARLAGLDDPAGEATARVLAGFRRSAAERGRGQVAGVRWEQADDAAAVAANGGQRLAGLRDAAVIAVMSDAMLRVSECAALDVADLASEPDGTGRATVRRSKTDQDGQGTVLFLGAPTVARVRAWLDAAGIEEGPLFRPVRRGDRVQAGRLTDRAIRRIIAARAADAGIDGRVSGHSLRVGSAQSLASAGASLVDLQTSGRWRDPKMPAHYAAGQLAGRGAVARLRYGRRTG